MSDQRDRPGPDQPHPLSTMKTELVWEGKYDERGNRRQPALPAAALPLRAAEIIGAPVAEPNRLVWGDNKLALQALLGEFRGQAKLVYIDPPFDIGADVTMGLRLGGDQAAPRPALEAVAYRDAWGRGADSYPQMMYERLVLLRQLLRPDGSIFVHCDWRVSAALRFILDEVFGKERLLNEIIWHYQSGGRRRDQFSHKHDTIYWYAASPDWTFNRDEIGELRGDARRNHMKRQVDGDGRVYFTIRSAGKTYAYYGDERLTPPDVWADISHLQQRDPQRTGYATQKPEALLERIVKAASDPGDLVLDCFCGSGTALAVAEKLGRRWIGVDLGRQAIRAARKRLIGVGRERQAQGRPAPPFAVCGLGAGERRWWLEDRLGGGEAAYRAAVLAAYQAATAAEPAHPLLHGRAGAAPVHVGPIDGALGPDELRRIAQAARAAGERELRCLAWEFAPDLARRKDDLAAELGLVIKLILIPREIMEPNRPAAAFFEAGALECELIERDGAFDVRLARFAPALAEADQRPALRERAAAAPLDFLDCWAIDFAWAGDRPFAYNWQACRERPGGGLSLRSDIAWRYGDGRRRRIGVKAIDIFGVESMTILETRR